MSNSVSDWDSYSAFSSNFYSVSFSDRGSLLGCLLNQISKTVFDSESDSDFDSKLTFSINFDFY